MALRTKLATIGIQETSYKEPASLPLLPGRTASALSPSPIIFQLALSSSIAIMGGRPSKQCRSYAHWVLITLAAQASAAPSLPIAPSVGSVPEITITPSGPGSNVTLYLPQPLFFRYQSGRPGTFSYVTWNDTTNAIATLDDLVEASLTYVPNDPSPDFPRPLKTASISYRQLRHYLTDAGSYGGDLLVKSNNSSGLVEYLRFDFGGIDGLTFGEAKLGERMALEVNVTNDDPGHIRPFRADFLLADYPNPMDDEPEDSTPEEHVVSTPENHLPKESTPEDSTLSFYTPPGSPVTTGPQIVCSPPGPESGVILYLPQSFFFHYSTDSPYSRDYVAWDNSTLPRATLNDGVEARLEYLRDAPVYKWDGPRPEPPPFEREWMPSHQLRDLLTDAGDYSPDQPFVKDPQRNQPEYLRFDFGQTRGLTYGKMMRGERMRLQVIVHPQGLGKLPRYGSEFLNDFHATFLFAGYRPWYRNPVRDGSGNLTDVPYGCGLFNP